MSLVSTFLSYLKKSNAHSVSAWFLEVTQKYELRVSFKMKDEAQLQPLRENVELLWLLIFSIQYLSSAFLVVSVKLLEKTFHSYDFLFSVYSIF